MNWITIITWIVLLALFIGAVTTLGVGASKSKDCVDECKTSRSLLIASDVLYIMAAISFAYGTHQYCGKGSLITSSILFIIASIMFGVGAGKANVCVGDCWTGIQNLIASNSLFLIFALVAGWHFRA